MARDESLEPEFPRDEGIPAPEPKIEDVEPVRLVENEVRGRLEAQGFDERQVLRWVEAYFAQHTGGDADDVIRWIEAQQRQSA